MLLLRRDIGQWVQVTDQEGRILRIQVRRPPAGRRGDIELAFDDDARHFEIDRPERQRSHETRPEED
jgi:hypothetical protein